MWIIEVPNTGGFLISVLCEQQQFSNLLLHCLVFF
ncbi:hypothetical protein EG68_02302 [Paragonimus skrjabini miyazakii]|uniref:Uncharacterized protein n=1 Tax=Paragonimus skrjabini miyazakii TaxID=59628 RepID=A0A8S9ZA79_9TREM|nr:hypothetical protein EG68_02302 [Paragonimus skrjabini miyazakii]